MANLVSSSKCTPAPVTNKPFVLVPLYIYPFPTAWDPLYVAVDRHPELDFLVVINPNSGPGPGDLPDANYIEALARLTAAPNVKVIGYVYCSYGNRLLEEIVAELTAYRGWTQASEQSEDDKTIVVDGIFFDEVPSSTDFFEYMTSLSNATKTILNRAPAAHQGNEVDQGGKAHDVSEKELGPSSPNSTGIAAPLVPVPSPATTPITTATGPAAPSPPPNSTAMVIYNPGVVVDPIFYQSADYIVAFENASEHWCSPTVAEGLSGLPPPLRNKTIAVAHSAAGGLVEVGQLSNQCFELGCPGQFITTRPGYEEWCPSWLEFVQEMARRTDM